MNKEGYVCRREVYRDRRVYPLNVAFLCKNFPCLGTKCFDFRLFDDFTSV